MLVVVFYTIGGPINLTSESPASVQKVGPKKQLLLAPQKSVINVFDKLNLGQQKSQFLQDVFAGVLQISLREEIIMMKYSFEVSGHQPYFTSRTQKSRAQKVWYVGMTSIGKIQKTILKESPSKDSKEWNAWVDCTNLSAIDIHNNTYELTMMVQQQSGDNKKK